MSSKATRIPIEAYMKLKAIAEERGVTIGTVIAGWVKDHEKNQFWDEYQRAAIEARNDPETWDMLEEEQRTWDSLRDEHQHHPSHEEVS